VPQDGRFRVKYKGARYIDLRVSICRRATGKTAVLRVLDKEGGNAFGKKFQSLSLDVVGFSTDEGEAFSPVHPRAVRQWCW